MTPNNTRNGKVTEIKFTDGLKWGENFIPQNKPYTNNTQTEQIVWHKYPNEKPARDDYYYVNMGFGEDCYGNRMALWKDGKWLKFWEINDAVVDGLIYAWAEEPKGWKE
jgi:hypothetical protein